MSLRFGCIQAFAAMFTAAVALTAPDCLLAQSTSIVISAGTATSIGLASAAEYQVLSDAQWADYEHVIVLCVLNGINKMAANNGQALKSSDYTTIASTVQSKLDASAPSTTLFRRMDVAGRLRYGIDAITSLAMNQAPGSLLPKALFGLERAKFFELEIPVDPSRRQPADTALYATSALQFIFDQIQEASDLAQNDSQYAVQANTGLKSLTRFDITSSYAQIQSSFGGALPALSSPNSDGSYSLNEQDLITQYKSVVGGIQALVDSDLTALANNPALQARVARPLDAASTTPTSCSVGTSGGEVARFV